MSIYQDDFETLCGIVGTVILQRQHHIENEDQEAVEDANVEVNLLKRIIYKTLKAELV